MTIRTARNFAGFSTSDSRNTSNKVTNPPMIPPLAATGFENIAYFLFLKAQILTSEFQSSMLDIMSGLFRNQKRDLS